MIRTSVAFGGAWPIAITNDGSVIAAGSFSRYDGQSRNGVVRLYPDGTVDDWFIPPANTEYVVAVAPLGNGALLQSNGDLDPSFEYDSAALGVCRSINAIAPQPDGRIFVGGYFWFNMQYPSIVLHLQGD
jgi:hypothetical protein